MSNSDNIESSIADSDSNLSEIHRQVEVHNKPTVAIVNGQLMNLTDSSPACCWLDFSKQPYARVWAHIGAQFWHISEPDLSASVRDAVASRICILKYCDCVFDSVSERKFDEHFRALICADGGTLSALLFGSTVTISPRIGWHHSAVLADILCSRQSPSTSSSRSSSSNLKHLVIRSNNSEALGRIAEYGGLLALSTDICDDIGQYHVVRYALRSASLMALVLPNTAYDAYMLGPLIAARVATHELRIKFENDYCISIGGENCAPK